MHVDDISHLRRQRQDLRAGVRRSARSRRVVPHQPGQNGGVKGSLGVAEDPSRFAIACRQTGAITLPDKLPREESVFSESTSLIFKNTKVVRMYDAKRNTLVYVAISRKVIEGSPMNSISTVPVQRWENR
jgi:CreA protein